MQTRSEYPLADATAAYALDLISPLLQSAGPKRHRHRVALCNKGCTGQDRCSQDLLRGQNSPQIESFRE